MWWRCGLGTWSLIPVQHYRKLRALPALWTGEFGLFAPADLQHGGHLGQFRLVLVGVMLAEKKLGSEGSLARTRAAAPQRSQRSALVSSGLVRVAFMALRSRVSSPSQTFGVLAVFPGRCRVCHFSRLSPPPIGQGGENDARSCHAGAPMRGAGVVACPRTRWIYPESDKTGYIHLSTLEQVHLPANRLYRGRADLVLLYIDPAALDSPVRWEPGVPTDPRSMLFPHLYGPLPVRAVIGAAAYPPAGDGSFGPAPEFRSATADPT